MRVCGCSDNGLSQGAGQWFELQDLHVQDLLPQMITLAEAYIQVYNIIIYVHRYKKCCVISLTDMGTENR